MEARDEHPVRVVLCLGIRCRRRGALRLLKVAQAGQGVLLIRARCLRLCPRAPVAVRYPIGTWYGRLTPELFGALLEGRSDEALESSVVFRMADTVFRPQIAAKALPEPESDLD